MRMLCWLFLSPCNAPRRLPGGLAKSRSSVALSTTCNFRLVVGPSTLLVGVRISEECRDRASTSHCYCSPSSVENRSLGFGNEGFGVANKRDRLDRFLTRRIFCIFSHYRKGTDRCARSAHTISASLQARSSSSDDRVL